MKRQQLIFWACILPAMIFQGCSPPHAGTDCVYPVRSGRSYGYMGPNGDLVIPPQYAYTLPFSEGLGAFNVGGTPSGRDMPANGKWGFLNARGDVVINPVYDSPPQSAAPYVPEELGTIRHDAYVFSEGWAPVLKDGSWMYIDRTGMEVLSPALGNLPEDVAAARGFHEGRANVLVRGRWGYIDKTGEFVVRPQMLYPADYREAHVLVVDEDLNWMVLDTLGQRVFPEYRVVSNFYQGYAAIMADFKGVPESNEKLLRFGFMDTSGVRTLAEPQFDMVGHFGEGNLCPVLVGSESSDERYSYPGMLVRAARRVGGKWGYVTPSGKFYISPTLDEARSFQHHVAAVRQGDFYAYMDINGAYLTDFMFRYAGDVNSCGISRVILGPAHNEFDGHFAYFQADRAEVVWIENDLPYNDLNW